MMSGIFDFSQHKPSEDVYWCKRSFKTNDSTSYETL